MYSRYIPNESGGYDRRELPDAADLRAAQSRPPPPPPEAMPPPIPRPRPPRQLPPPQGPRPSGGRGGLLAGLLPHGLDSEDLLVLAVLLLSMKQDGAGPTELLMAAGLYFWL